MLPALEDAVFKSTPALAVEDDVADGGDTEAAGAVAEAMGEPGVTAGLVAAGVLPPPPHPLRAAERARIARPAPNTCRFMGCSFCGARRLSSDANHYDAPG
jgi:hypothetical protein